MKIYLASSFANLIQSYITQNYITLKTFPNVKLVLYLLHLETLITNPTYCGHREPIISSKLLHTWWLITAFVSSVLTKPTTPPNLLPFSSFSSVFLPMPHVLSHSEPKTECHTPADVSPTPGKDHVLSCRLCCPAWASLGTVYLSCKGWHRRVYDSLYLPHSFPCICSSTVFPLARMWADDYSCPSVIAYTSHWILFSFKARQFFKLVKLLLNSNLVASLNRYYLQLPECAIYSNIPISHENDPRLDFGGITLKRGLAILERTTNTAPIVY